MRKLLATLSTIAMVGTLFVGAPAPVLADPAVDSLVGSGEIHTRAGGDPIINLADDLEEDGTEQLYVAEAEDTLNLSLDLFAADEDATAGIFDEDMVLTLAGGTGLSFGDPYEDGTDALCTIDWEDAGAAQTATVRHLDVDCDAGSGQDEVNVPFTVTLPDHGSAVLTVTDAGSTTFKVYFMAEEEDDDIYVGQDADLAAGAGSCGAAGPDFSTTNATQDLDVQQAIDFALQSINEDGDTVIICDGTYNYEGSIREYHAEDLYQGTLTMRADTTGEVTFNGGGMYHLLNVSAADLSVEGIDFDNGLAYNGGAIYVANDFVDDVLVGGSLTVLDSNFTGNHANGDWGAGGAIYVEGSLTLNAATFEENNAYDDDEDELVGVTKGGAIYVYGGDYGDEHTIIADAHFDANYADNYGGAVAIDDSTLTVIRTVFTDNEGGEGGAIYTYDTEWSVTDSTFGSATDDHDEPDQENYAEEGGDIYSATGEIENAVNATITNSKFYDSRSTSGDGASLHLECTAVSITNSLFHSTDADVSAVVFLTDSELGEGGWSRDCDDYRTSISRSTFTDNYASDDGVIYVDGGDESEGIRGLLSLTVTNSLFSGNVADEEEGVFDVEGPVDISIINSRFERNSAGDNGAVIEMDGGDDDSDTTNGSLTFSRNQVRFNSGGTQGLGDEDYAEGDGMIQLDDVHSWQIDYNTFQGNSADRGAVLAFEVDEDDLRDLVQLNGFRRNTVIGNSASVGGSYLFIQYNDNASNVNRASIKRIEKQVKKNRNVIKGGTRPQILQLLEFLTPEDL